MVRHGLAACLITRTPINNDPIRDLFVGALSAMQAANETDPLSYFQIMGTIREGANQK